jgi:hypothetical protein
MAEDELLILNILKLLPLLVLCSYHFAYFFELCQWLSFFHCNFRSFSFLQTISLTRQLPASTRASPTATSRTCGAPSC